MLKDIPTSFNDVLGSITTPQPFAEKSNTHSTLDKLSRKLGNTSLPIDQSTLCDLLSLSSSFLVYDSTTNNGISAWLRGFERLIDFVVALHEQNQLEVATVNAASRACSECWSVSTTWREMDEARTAIRRIAGRLKGVLDENKRTFKGEAIYAP